MDSTQEDVKWMNRALELARRGLGRVEPNPMVGCVLVQKGEMIGQGWHERFGEQHAEVNALRNAQLNAQRDAQCDAHLDAKGPVAGCTAYVTLEPCAHQGKTPPCVTALIQAGVARVVVAHPDPFPQVAGRGLEQLQRAGIQVDLGILQSAAQSLLAPYLKRVTTGLPWIIAKWAMTWDGKIATARGDSQWISNESSRQIVHEIRGRVDAIMVGANTALQDDPLLTARPVGSRVATRIVVDSRARLPLDSQLCQTASQVPTLIAVGPRADTGRLQALQSRGCEVWLPNPSTSQATSPVSLSPSGPPDDASRRINEANARLIELLRELARRGMTNVLVEGGAGLLGSLFDLRLIDEVHVFIGGKLMGGHASLTPVGGIGVPAMSQTQPIELESVRQLENDVYLVGRTQSTSVDLSAKTRS